MAKKTTSAFWPDQALGELLGAMSEELQRRSGKKPGKPGGAFAALAARWGKSLEEHRNQLFDVYETKALETSKAREKLGTARAAELGKLARGEGERPAPARGRALVTGHLTQQSTRTPLPDVPLRLVTRKGRKVTELARTFSDAYGTYHFDLDATALASAAESGVEVVIEVLDAATDAGKAVLSKVIGGLGPDKTVAVALAVEGDALPDSRARGARLAARIEAERAGAEGDKRALGAEREELRARLDEARLAPLVPGRRRAKSKPEPVAEPEPVAGEPAKPRRMKPKAQGKD